MKVKLLFEGKYQIVAVMDGDACPAEQFLHDGEDETEAARLGLLQILEFLAANGLDKASHAWVHEADKKKQIFEFIKGPLRLFFFKGHNGQIAVCTDGVRKKTRKADKGSVSKAGDLRSTYMAAIESETLEIIEDEQN